MIQVDSLPPAYRGIVRNSSHQLSSDAPILVPMSCWNPLFCRLQSARGHDLLLDRSHAAIMRDGVIADNATVAGVPGLRTENDTGCC